MPLLGQIDTPNALADLSLFDLSTLCAEIRRTIIETVAQNGGHLSSNLGVVELTVALHIVFSSPKDAIVWDVGHQCYAHKLLTGRSDRFPTIRQAGGISGFPRREESPHDAFDTGHSSTSVSTALGLLAAEKLLGGTGLAVAVIGDGAMTGGLAYEALSHAGQAGLPLIVILNDNNMSISANVGGISKHLSRLSMTGKYQKFRRNFDAAVRRIPSAGERIYRIINRLKRAVKAVFYQDNFFVDLGFEYAGPVDGHDLRGLIDILNDVKELRRPVVVHVITRKGRGYGPAEDAPGAYHSVGPFDIKTGRQKEGGESWTRAFSFALEAAGRENEKIVAITAAMEKGTGLSRFKNVFPERFFDTGIAEAHAVTFAAALAAKGLRPVVAIYSTFLQRSVDSIIHDAARGPFPVIFAIDRAGFVPGDGETHQGLFDIALLRAVPSMTIMCPACASELKAMLRAALKADGPCAIRYPKAALPEECPAFDAEPVPGRGVLIRSEKKAEDRTLLMFTGSLWDEARRAAAKAEEKGVVTDLYNVRYVKPVDEDYLRKLFTGYRRVIFAEEGARRGGAGEYFAALASDVSCRIIHLAAEDRYYPHASREELLAAASLDFAGMVKALTAP